jgi:hypothetical protein
MDEEIKMRSRRRRIRRRMRRTSWVKEREETQPPTRLTITS